MHKVLSNSGLEVEENDLPNGLLIAAISTEPDLRLHNPDLTT